MDSFNLMGYVTQLMVIGDTFNSIVWILHHHASCSLWKFLSSPLYGFYSIKPPDGGSMYMVYDLVFKLFALILHQFSHVVNGSFHCILLAHKLMDRVSEGNVYKLWFMWGL